MKHEKGKYSVTKLVIIDQQMSLYRQPKIKMESFKEVVGNSDISSPIISDTIMYDISSEYYYSWNIGSLFYL